MMEGGEGYRQFAARLTESGILSDPWLDGRPRFATQPHVLTPDTDRSLRAAAEAVAALHEEVAQLCLADAALLARYFSFTPYQRLMWEASAPAWHGLARADVFLTDAGPAVCELNCDTPSGEAEAVLLNAAAARSGLIDPNRELGERFCELVEAVCAGLEAGGPRTVGIIYPTEIVEDLSMILLYQRWLEARGWRVVLGSPFNLRRIGDRPALFGEACSVFVRHYKTDWWGEREPIWRDAPPFTDAQPLAGPLSILLDGTLAGRCAVVNPFGSVLTQNKRSMALLWEERERFPAWAQDAIERYLPYTARLESLRPEELADRAQWVLKSDYGCEGAEVVIGASVTEAEWVASLAQAVPQRWIAQRYFRAQTDEQSRIANYGVYLIGGAASGYFTRVHAGATGYDALSVPTFIEGSP
jgi:glutathionylspermidine synthase